MASSLAEVGLPNRQPMNEVIEQYEEILKSPVITQLLECTSIVSLIINPSRQVVYANDWFRKMLGKMDMEGIIGKRPGEMVSCIHSNENEYGCGTTESCRFCGAFQVIMESMKERQRVVRDAHLTIGNNNGKTQLDLQISSSPVDVNGETYFVVTMNDISSDVRRRSLERTFFHDMINSTMGLSGMIEIAASMNKDRGLDSILTKAASIAMEIKEDILTQKDISSAEKGELKVKVMEIDVPSFLDECLNHVEYLIPGSSRVRCVWEDRKIIIWSDPSLIKRIVLNLLKNALEADNGGKDVLMDFSIAKGEISISIWNAAYIQPEVQVALFQRSCSTKGEGRGIGIYSVRLFTEEYLKGRITFTSDQQYGTTFTIVLPEKI